jgi:hypothetical protein
MLKLHFSNTSISNNQAWQTITDCHSCRIDMSAMLQPTAQSLRIQASQAGTTAPPTGTSSSRASMAFGQGYQHVSSLQSTQHSITVLAIAQQSSQVPQPVSTHMESNNHADTPMLGRKCLVLEYTKQCLSLLHSRQSTKF